MAENTKKVTCLKCGKQWSSPNPKYRRICNRCRTSNKQLEERMGRLPALTSNKAGHGQKIREEEN